MLHYRSLMLTLRSALWLSWPSSINSEVFIVNKRTFLARIIATLSFAFFAANALSADSMYDEPIDAKAQIKTALGNAANDKVPLLIVFGADWCGDCKVLDMAMKSGSVAPLITRDFKVVKINVGKFDKNVDIAESYGVPLKKGIPAVAIVSQQNVAIYVTKTGELADARKMGDQGIFDFFKRVASDVKAKS
jgi:thioredoxin 1